MKKRTTVRQYSFTCDRCGAVEQHERKVEGEVTYDAPEMARLDLVDPHADISRRLIAMDLCQLCVRGLKAYLNPDFVKRA